MEAANHNCRICNREFEVRFRYQVREEDGEYLYICSQACQQKMLAEPAGGCACSTCGRTFSFEYPYQVSVGDGVRQYFCTPKCRQLGTKHPASAQPVRQEARRIAVFNHKGGTGKTTTAVNLAAGMAESGKRVLLIDADGQGNVGASLGIRGQKTFYHVLVHGASAEEVAVPVRDNLDVVTSNELLAAAELHLTERPNRDRVMRERLGAGTMDYDVVVLDCAPALSLMNQNALVYADSVIVPVACDYLSLIGVKQVLRTMSNVRKLLAHEVQLLGVLPTFFDVRNRISREALFALRKHFGKHCYDPIRVNTKLKEAPSAKQTIFEYAPASNGAADYLRLVSAILESHSTQQTDEAESTEGEQVQAAC